MEQRAAIIRTIQGEKVDESALPVLPEKANAPVRFEHTRDGKAPFRHTLQTRYGHLVNNNTCVTRFNTLEALKEKYDTVPQVKKEEGVEQPAAASDKKKKLSSADKAKQLPSLLTRRMSGRGRDRTAKPVTGSTPVKQEDGDEAMADGDDEEATAAPASAAVEVDAEEMEGDDQVRYGEYGKPAHVRRSKSKLSRRRAKSKGRNGFLNFHNMAATS